MAKTSNDIKRSIKSRQAYLGLSNEDIAVKMRMSISSWNRRMRKPDTINVDELIRLEKILKYELLEVK